MTEQLALFSGKERINHLKEFLNPSGYRGLDAFHKYWGKKPPECISFLIESLSNPGDLVVDPFIGSGVAAREAIFRGRRFAGSDINPIAVELAQFQSGPPAHVSVADAFQRLIEHVQPSIEQTYKLPDGRVATHYLWAGRELKEIWVARKGQVPREVLQPHDADRALFDRWESYSPALLRDIGLFDNSRINSKKSMEWHDLFTGRALRNIETLLHAIHQEPSDVRRALLLVLTAALGQMSKMVFVINRRGKNSGQSSGRTEVGSWVIGYWRPEQHFEVNVWNSFANRAKRLLKSLQGTEKDPRRFQISSGVAGDGQPGAVIRCEDAIEFLSSLPDDSIDLLITDPPHGDRIPYLELSEMWNAVLGVDAEFNKEIVVSNARGRNKDKSQYLLDMQQFFEVASKRLRPGSYMAVLFNTRDADIWQGLCPVSGSYGMYFLGAFPMTYSAGSVVQDNRKGSLKHDMVMVYRKGSSELNSEHRRVFERLPGWSIQFPT